jgi:hypothetical protein
VSRVFRRSDFNLFIEFIQGFVLLDWLSEKVDPFRFLGERGSTIHHGLGILLLRTYAIWENDRRIAGILFLFLLGMVAGMGVFVERFLESTICKLLPNIFALFSLRTKKFFFD